MKPYNYQAVWAGYSGLVLRKNDMLNFNGQLNSTIIETHTVGMKRGRENFESRLYAFNFTVLISLTFSLPLLR